MGKNTFNFRSKDVAMDLGTVNTLIYVRGKGIVLDEPSIVTVNRASGAIVATGLEAKDFSGRHGEDFLSCRPMRSGVISDFDVASHMIRSFLQKVFGRTPFMRPKLVIAVPTGITTAEKRALIEAAERAGAGKVHLIHEPVAAAIGTGLRVDQPIGHMVVNIGGGTTEIAVVCKYTVACCESLRIAGDEIDEAICQHLRHVYQVDVSPMMAESIKVRIGSTNPSIDRASLSVQGKDISTGMPKTITVTQEDVQEAVKKPATAIVCAVKRVLENASPDLAADVSENGIWLTGGGSLLKGWRQLFREVAGLDVQISQDPLRSTIRGVAVVTEQFPTLRGIVFNGKPATFAKVSLF